MWFGFFLGRGDGCWLNIAKVRFLIREGKFDGELETVEEADREMGEDESRWKEQEIPEEGAMKKLYGEWRLPAQGRLYIFHQEVLAILMLLYLNLKGYRLLV